MPFNIDPAKSQIIDTHFQEFLKETDYWQGKVLLDYSLMMHQAWRPILPLLPLGDDITVGDIGTGYGLLAAELAANLRLCVHGIDLDETYVDGARELSRRLGKQDIFQPGSSLEFQTGNICSIPCPDSSFEFTMVREVFQFVDDLELATSEIRRVTKPTGFVCVSDNDDGLFLSYPEPSEAFRRIHKAIEEEQASYGGDRKVGRKISTLLAQGGFSILAVSVIPEARHWTVTPQDPESTFMIHQIREAKERLVAARVIGADEFDDLVGELEREPTREQFRFNARVVVVGRKL